MVAALTFGRPEDLDTARRLIVERPLLDEAQRPKLASLDADLATL